MSDPLLYGQGTLFFVSCADVMKPNMTQGRSAGRVPRSTPGYEARLLHIFSIIYRSQDQTRDVQCACAHISAGIAPAVFFPVSVSEFATLLRQLYDSVGEPVSATDEVWLDLHALGPQFMNSTPFLSRIGLDKGTVSQ